MNTLPRPVIAAIALLGLAFIACSAGGQAGTSTPPGSVGWAGATAAPAPITITLAEFDAIQNGMTVPDVEAVIGGPGKVLSTAGAGAQQVTMLTWDGEGGPGANANVTFNGGRVFAKAQFGLK